MSELEPCVPAVCPPKAFGIVAPGIYRANAFHPRTFTFVQALHLQTIVYVSPELPPVGLQEFVERSSIEIIHRNHSGDSSWRPIPEGLVKETLELILNRNMHPIMIMCSDGIHETGTVVGCLRKLQQWDLVSILDEYRRYAGSKAREMNELFIEFFDVDLITLPVSNLPEWFVREQSSLDELGQSASLDQVDEESYRKYIRNPFNSPLISSKVKFDKKKSLLNDED